MKKIMKIIGIILIVIILMAALLFLYAAKKPAVPKNYETSVKTGGEIEGTYLAHGNFTVKYTEQGALENYKKYEVYYPAELETGSRKYRKVSNVPA